MEMKTQGALQKKNKTVLVLFIATIIFELACFVWSIIEYSRAQISITVQMLFGNIVGLTGLWWLLSYLFDKAGKKVIACCLAIIPFAGSIISRLNYVIDVFSLVFSLISIISSILPFLFIILNKTHNSVIWSVVAIIYAIYTVIFSLLSIITISRVGSSVGSYYVINTIGTILLYIACAIWFAPANREKKLKQENSSDFSYLDEYKRKMKEGK
ncbi:MAG: hypothetical protein IJ662_09130 [Clostridia bacterium]|nr:hypothetical protein [Clostridia bacterium]